MLQKFIKNIRAKPESVRKGITLGVSLGITGIVSFFWFISFLNYSTQVLTAKPPVESPTSFLGKMGTLIGESYANVRSKIGSSDTAFIQDNASSTNNDVKVSASSTDSTGAVEESSFGESAKESTTTTPDDSASNKSNSNNSSKSLGDILNTKTEDNQDEKATTSSEVLVQ